MKKGCVELDRHIEDRIFMLDNELDAVSYWNFRKRREIRRRQRALLDMLWCVIRSSGGYMP